MREYARYGLWILCATVSCAPAGDGSEQALSAPASCAPNGCAPANVCPDGLVDVQGECRTPCGEATVDGLNGYCAAPDVCVQGTCIVDVCAGLECPALASCVIRGEVGECQCNDSLHWSDGMCCGQDASNSAGSCACDDGFEPNADGHCWPTDDNPCFPNPCNDVGTHRSTCAVVAEAYSCACDSGYVDNMGDCVLAESDACPGDLKCMANYCVPADQSAEQCLTDVDCHEFFAEAPSVCNASAAGGICLGCVQHSDCPGSSQCNNFGTCANLCDDNNDCPYGRCLTSVGMCGQSYCVGNSDCFNGTVCLDEDGDGRGLCKRIPCSASVCSQVDPTGACDNPAERCLYGSCVGACNPNPCTAEPHKGNCTLTSDGPECSCNSGYTIDAHGNCQLEPASSCSGTLTCEDGKCVDRSLTNFQCADATDCGQGLSCSSNLPSGICSGCTLTQGCPGAAICLAGYCFTPCSSHAQCGGDMLCQGSGYCGKKSCGAAGNCSDDSVCVVGSDGAGTCRRHSCQ